MASKFVNTQTTVLDGNTGIPYTTPTATESIVIGFQIANTGTATANVDVTIGGLNIIGVGTPIPINSALVPIEGKLNLMSGDAISVTTNGADVDVILSVLELT